MLHMTLRSLVRAWALVLAILGSAWPMATGMAQAASETPHSTIEGQVFDSLAHAPLAGAAVNMVSTDSRKTYGAVSDSAGHFIMENVDAGAYFIGFFHPLLDSIGIQPPARRLTIGGGRKQRQQTVDLAVPSGDGIHDAVCGRRAKHDSTGVLVGHVQDATTGAFISGAAVTAQWSTLRITGGQLVGATPAVSVRSGSTGWFAFCGLPAGEQLSIVAASGADSSGVVGYTVAAHQAVHRDLFVGPAERVTHAVRDTGATADSLLIPEEVLYRGPARLRGLVRDATSHLPLPDVQVTVVGTGLTTKANERGEFSIGQLPLGTRAMVARKVGYLPTEVLIDLRAGDTASVAIELPTLKTFLDTVRVNANRVYSSDRNGFNRRRTAGFGHYYDAAEVERIAPLETSDLVARVPGVHSSTMGLDRSILMRGAQGKYCAPPIYLDGFLQWRMGFAELDMLVHPNQIEAIEVYSSSIGVPPEFMQGYDATCGVVAVWTRAARPHVREP
jgi:Carboxypeptidase regulatory-like domain